MSEKKNKLTLDSKISELYKNPVGHDTLSKVLLQLGLPESTLTNPVVANMKVSAVVDGETIFSEEVVWLPKLN